MSDISLTATLRALTWVCVLVLAVLSLLPADMMVRTGLPGPVNHFIAYAGAAAIATAGYARSRGTVRILALLCVYGGVLEYLQHFSPGRDPSFTDFVVSVVGSLCGGIAAAILWPRFSKGLHL
jgi:VanZ family protein